MRKKRSILSKLVINGFITVILSFLIAGTILFGMATQSVRIANEEKNHILTLNAKRISEFSLDVFKNDWSPLSSNYVRTLNMIAQSIDSHIIIFDSNGYIIAVGGLDEKEFLFKPLSGEYVDIILSGESISAISTIDFFENKDMLTVGMPVKGSISYGGVLVSTPSVSMYSAYSDILSQYGFAALIALVMAFALFYFLSKRITKPIKQMNNAVVEFSRGDFTKRVNCTTKDELETLAKNINEMAESIENLEKTRSEFISNVSHELRTPMTSITGFVEGMRDGTIPKEKHDEYLKIVHDECRRLSKLVDDLLKLTRLENGKAKLEKSIFNINELLRICILQFEKEISEKNIEIFADFKEDINVFADKNSIMQVVTNIMHNAVKFTDENGKIELSLKESENKVLVKIKNTGRGIEKEKIKYIFDRFYKEDASRSKNPDGMGLGLYIVKSIINQHKEQIKADSEEGKWTSFTFTLSKP
ncbi:MAG: cell wall metabolism sensor histidine kinase WalK [Ruminococcaceae bacterium]|nr:cell wall metabolism sensor histidine kinase WalK [Oscillospiraceae bacterium]